MIHLLGVVLTVAVGILIIGACFGFKKSPWAWLASLRTGVSLLIVIAVASMAGTFIHPLSRALAIVFHAWWYEGLLILLFLSVSASTVRTIRKYLYLRKNPPVRRADSFFRDAKPSRGIPFEGDIEDAAERFRKHGFRVATREDNGYAGRRLWGWWGAPIAHIGVLIILAGGFASGFVAREGYVRLLEGEATDDYAVTGGATEKGEEPEREPLGFTLLCDDFETGYFPQTKIPSKFTSTVTILEDGRPVLIGEQVEPNRVVSHGGWRLHQSNYGEQPGAPRRFLLAVKPPDDASTATFELSQGQTRVMPGRPDVWITLGRGMPPEWLIRLRKTDERVSGRIEIPGTLYIVADQFEPDFAVGQGGEITTRSQDPNNPALHVTIENDNRPVHSTWLFGEGRMKELWDRMMGADGGDIPYEFDLAQVDGEPGAWKFRIRVTPKSASDQATTVTVALNGRTRVGPASGVAKPAEQPEEDRTGGWRVTAKKSVTPYWTGLSLTSNPAIPVVYFGCVVTMAGLTVAFLIRRREVWFRLDRSAKRLDVAADYRSLREEFDPATWKVVDELSEEAGEGSETDR